jgi:Tetratricopeptide repeat
MPADPLDAEFGYIANRMEGADPTENRNAGRVDKQSRGKPDARHGIVLLPPRNPFFTGREQELGEIHSRFFPESAVMTNSERAGPTDDRIVGIVPVQGMGGVGKTQLALEYVHRHSAEYGIVWWVNADDPALALRDLSALASQLGLPVGSADPTGALPGLWAFMAARQDWLLVYDNIDSPAVLADLRPPGSGRLLVTGRSQVLGRLAPSIELGEFHRADSVHLLTRRCPTLTRADAHQVADALGDLPLAVEQAGCFLNEIPISTADYLDLLADQPAAGGLSDATLDRHPGLAAVVSAGRAQLETISHQAAVLLDQLAFLSPERLPITVGQAAEQRGPHGVLFGDAATASFVIHQFVDLGLARLTGSTIQIHRLVQALLRARLTPQEQRARCHDAQELLATAVTSDPDDPVSWPTYALLTSHLQALLARGLTSSENPPQFRSLLLQILRYLFVTGQYQNVVSLARDTYTLWERTLGPDHFDTLSSANSLAAALHKLGDNSSARYLDEDTLQRRQQVLGADHRDTLISANGLAAVLRALEGHKAARDLDRDTLQRRHRVLGADHPDTLRSASNLAIDLRALGDHAAARDLHSDTLQRQRRVLGADHPDTLRSASNLAIDLAAVRKQQEGSPN